MKIKIIDLLNKINNNEIKIGTRINVFYKNTGKYDLNYLVYKKVGLEWYNEEIDLREPFLMAITDLLNMEFEITEEVKLPELIKNAGLLGGITEEIATKINDLISYLESKEEGKEKEDKEVNE